MLYDEKQLYKEGFNQDQVEEIIDGQMAGVDVSAYASKNFLAVQMRQVRIGLVAGLDVTEYAHDFYDWFQMEEIRKGLSAGVDVTKYAMPSVTCDRMHELRKALAAGIDLTPHRRREAKVLRLLREAALGGYSISEFLDEGYGAEELEEISRAVREGQDIRQYINPCMCANAIREIALGLSEHLDVSLYRNDRLNWRQMRELRLGLMHRVDAKRYCDELYSWRQMRELRLGLEEGLDISQYSFFYCTDTEMKHRREAMLQTAGKLRGTDGWYEYFFDTEKRTQGSLQPDGRIDFSGVKWFDVVTEGQTLAVYHSAQCGKAQTNEAGQTVAGRFGREKDILSGAGITPMEEHQRYAAAIGGKAELDGDSVRVTKLLVVDQLALLDVKIVFDGTVYVRGRVESGTTIRATGEIVVDGLVENAQLLAGGNILLRGGARGTEFIRSDENIAATFLEGANVLAKGSIQANDSRDSVLCAGGTIRLFGTITGGSAQAQHGVRVGSAGDELHTPTRLSCELSESAEALERSLEEKRLSVNREIGMLTNSLADYEQMYSPEQRYGMEFYIKIENAIYIRKKQLQNILKQRAEIWRLKEKVNQSNIMVDNQLNEGVEVVIGGSTWRGEMRENVIIGKQQGEIVVESGRKEAKE